jgi:signal transduction histidine kinase
MPAASAGPEPEPEPSAGERVDILLVDDDLHELRAVAAVLDAPDRNLVHAGSGDEALRYLAEHEVALVVLPVSTRAMDSFDTAARIRARESSRDTPIMFLSSATPDEHVVARAYALGAVDLLARPVDPLVLRAKVAMFVDVFRKNRQIRRQAAQLVGTTASLRETIEARDRALARVEHAMQTRDDFLATASHDLRAPLTVIRAQAQLLARRAARGGGRDAAATLAALNKIDLATRKMTRLVDQMLDVAQLQVGHPLQLNKRPTDLVQVAQEVINELDDPEASRRVRLETGEASLVGTWDAARVERALSNLVSNAVKFSPQGGEVVVSLARETREAGQEWAIVQVRDQGVGIPADELPRIFDRFFRGRNVVGKIYGTGIGLAGVRQIVEQHGGIITVESAEGAGTTVTLELPFT